MNNEFVPQARGNFGKTLENKWVPIRVNENGIPKIDVNTNNASGDAFGRLRVSSPETIFESKLLNGGGAKIWSEEKNGTATIVKDNDTSSVELTVNLTGEYAIRQTLQRFQYQSGKSQLILLTGILVCKVGIDSSIGLAEGEHGSHVAPFSIYNGIYFHSSNNVLSVSITNNGVTNNVIQSAWNIDKFDGTGVSGITIDCNKANIFVIDYEWLGIGRVRYGFNVDGVTYYCHEIKHANSVSNVYVRTPNLSIRYEISSTGGTASVKQICSSISSEGGRQQTGLVQIGTSDYLAIPTSGAFNTNPITHSLFAAMRHQESKPYSFVKLLSQVILTLGDNPIKWSISLLPGTSLIKDNGVDTAFDDLTFTALPDSTLEFFQFDITQDTVLDTVISPYVIEEGYVGAAFKTASQNLGDVNNLVSIGEEINGSRWCFLFSIQSYGTNEGRSSLKFGESL